MAQGISKQFRDHPFFSEIDALQALVTDGVREAVENTRLTHPDETFYIFGVDVPFDLGAFYLGGNTLENLATIDADYRYLWTDWGDYEVLEPQPILRSTWAWIDERIREYQTVPQDQRDAFMGFQEQAMLTIGRQAMKENDRAGLFGTGRNRHATMLYASCGGGSYEDAYFLKSVKILNPSPVWKELKTFMRPRKDDLFPESRAVLGF